MILVTCKSDVHPMPGARLAGPSLPLDVGHSAQIPAAIRRAVILRDQHCRWAGGYFF